MGAWPSVSVASATHFNAPHAGSARCAGDAPRRALSTRRVGSPGGDWFDAFPLPGGQLGLTIGDVVGRGFQSPLMGQLRSGLRAYATQHLSSAEALVWTERVDPPDRAGAQRDRALHGRRPRARRGDGIRSRPPGSASGAGQWRCPVRRDAGRRPAWSGQAAALPEPTLDLAQGRTLTLFTDGWSSAAARTWRRASRSSARRRCRPDPNVLCETIVAALLGDGSRHDDAALLVAHTERISTLLSLLVPPEIDAPPDAAPRSAEVACRAGSLRARCRGDGSHAPEACANAIDASIPRRPAGWSSRDRCWTITSGNDDPRLRALAIAARRPPGRGMQLMEWSGRCGGDRPARGRHLGAACAGWGAAVVIETLRLEPRGELLVARLGGEVDISHVPVVRDRSARARQSGRWPAGRPLRRDVHRQRGREPPVRASPTVSGPTSFGWW